MKNASGSNTSDVPHVPKRVHPPPHRTAAAAPVRVSPPHHLTAPAAPEHITAHDRCAFVGDVPRDLDEPHIKRLVEEAGYARPTRALVRASTGSKAGYFAVLYFETMEAATTFKSGGMTWPGGVVAEVRLLCSGILLI